MSQPRGTHEDFSRKHAIKAGSERSFGIVFAAVFALVGLAPLWGGGAARIWALGIAASFLVVTLARPALLGPANRLWTRFGLLLGAIVAPVVMALVFVVAVVPTAAILRLAGKDPLRLKFEPAADTYWLRRDPPGPDPTTMPRQF